MAAYTFHYGMHCRHQAITAQKYAKKTPKDITSFVCLLSNSSNLLKLQNPVSSTLGKCKIKEFPGSLFIYT